MNYRYILKEELWKRCQSNKKYSLRKFAQFLELHPSRLSEVINGKQGLSIHVAQKIGRKLGYKGFSLFYFKQTVLASDSRESVTRERAYQWLQNQNLQGKKLPFRVLKSDEISLVSHWQNFALRELLRLPDQDHSPEALAQRLNIKKSLVHQSLKNLEKLNLIEFKSQRWHAVDSNYTTTCDIPSQHIQNYNLQVLDQAKKALKEQTVDERDYSTLTVAIPKKMIPLLKEKIKLFRREFNKACEEELISQGGDEVYSLAIQFYRVTK
ncbi:MAG: TIGR02147 family protein [Bdellovibrionales bacterium]|nr:TIGR02147 family protein [Bdellovibrionales bacterium]